MTRGSRKHILDWTARRGFPAEFSELVGLSDCAVARPPVWQPRGHSEPAEACVEDCGAQFLPGTDCWNDLAAWWLVHPRGANKPNWDLVVACDFAGKPGLALLEAKRATSSPTSAIPYSISWRPRNSGWSRRGGSGVRAGATSSGATSRAESASRHRHDDVSRDGHALLAGEAGGGDAGVTKTGHAYEGGGAAWRSPRPSEFVDT